MAWTFGFGRRPSTGGAPAVLARTKGDGPPRRIEFGVRVRF